jgi:predicted transcriptional regulator
MQIGASVFSAIVSAIGKTASNNDQKVYEFLENKPATEKYIANRLGRSSASIRDSLSRLLALGSICCFENVSAKEGDRVYSRVERSEAAKTLSARAKDHTKLLTKTQARIVELLSLEPVTTKQLCDEFGYKPSEMLKALKQMAKKNRYRQALVELQATEGMEKWALINLEAKEN